MLAITARHLQEGLHKRILESLTADFDQRLEIIAADNGEHEDERFAAFSASDAALAVSGTVTLELALTHTPAVVAYRLDRLSWWLAQRLIRVPMVALSNIVGGREIVPELLQDKASPERIAQQLIPLLLHQASYIQQKHYLAEVAERLHDPQSTAESHRGNRGARTVGDHSDSAPSAHSEGCGESCFEMTAEWNKILVIKIS